MKSSPLLLFIVTLLVSISLQAEEPWHELFDGKSLSGWKANAYPDSWTVVDGVIKANATKESSHLFYIGDGKNDFVRFKNFELEVICRAAPGSNSGIFIHTGLETHASAKRLSKGYEIQLNSTEKEKRKTGSLYAVVDLDRSPVDETQWFTTRIIVQDQHITIQVNGVTTVDYTEPADAAAQRPPERKGRVLSSDGGAIALQAHDPKSVFYFKSVRIRSLP